MILKRTAFALFALMLCGLGVATIAFAPVAAVAGDDGGGDGGGPGAPEGGGDGGGPGAP